MTTIALENSTATPAKQRHTQAVQEFRRAEEAYRLAHLAPPMRIDSHGRTVQVHDVAEMVVLREEVTAARRDASFELQAARRVLLTSNIQIANHELARLAPRITKADKAVERAEQQVEKVTAQLIASGWALDRARLDRKMLVREAIKHASDGCVDDEVRHQLVASARTGRVTVELDDDGRPAEQLEISDNDHVGDREHFAGIASSVEMGVQRAERVWSDNALMRAAVREYTRITKEH